MSEKGKCLLLVNTSSGNAGKIVDSSGILEKLGSEYMVVHELRISSGNDFDLEAYCAAYDALAVCGGDGTFNLAVNAIANSGKQLLYFPCGTVNDAAHSLKSVQKGQSPIAVDLGCFNGTYFSYVAAAGSFTAVGYKPKRRSKVLFKRLAYCFQAVKEYRVHSIKAKIEADDRVFEDIYTLIMLVKSRCVFGFNFNKLFNHNSGSGHLLLIKTPTGLFKLTKLFCLFFRAFFVGFKKEIDKKNIKFLEFSKAVIDLENECDFCIDGEKYHSLKHNEAAFYKEKITVTIL